MEGPTGQVSNADLRVFDEEDCRDFLALEIGVEIPPFLPYKAGIDHVYQRLLSRYGPANVADALSVLIELLEDDDSATGQGDDGDVWRSWRHDWRHRNVSLCSIFHFPSDLCPGALIALCVSG